MTVGNLIGMGVHVRIHQPVHFRKTDVPAQLV